MRVVLPIELLLWLPGFVMAQRPPASGQTRMLTFDEIFSQVVGTLPFTIAAAANFGPTDSFASTAPAVCAVAGGAVREVGSGTCSAAGSRPGNATHAVATPAAGRFAVADNSQTPGLTTYAYTGNPFTSAQSPYAKSDSVAGYFTTFTLAANLAGVNITSDISTFSFTDGVNTITPSNAWSVETRIVVSTDSQSRITAWDITLVVGRPPINYAIFTCNGISTYYNSCPNGPFDWSYEQNGAGPEAGASVPGAWSATPVQCAGSTEVVGSVAWDGSPLANATAELLTADNKVLASATTGSDGSFGMANLPFGQFAIDVIGPSNDYWQFAGPPVIVTAGCATNLGVLSLSKMFQLLSPANNVVISTATPTLQWAAFPGATQYAVDVYGGGPGEGFSQSTGATQTSVSPGLSSGSYSWEVYAYDTTGQIANSSAWNFTIVTGPPAISPGGVVPVDSPVNTIQAGEWVSIYGTNLASATAAWSGDFPTSLGGTSVTIDGKAAYLSYVSPTQINLQAPDDTTTGSVSVVVTSANGTSTSTVTLAQFAPSFLLLDSKHVTGIILRSDGSGAYGGGTYDMIGPTGSSLGYATVAAKAGDTVELFAVGLGPTSPAVPAGQAFSGAAPTTNAVNLLINNVGVTPAFAGLSEAGLYQINLTVPAGLGTGDVSLVATVGGVQTPPNVLISLQ